MGEISQILFLMCLNDMLDPLVSLTLTYEGLCTPAMVPKKLSLRLTIPNLYT
jgi:hypothetical protein